MIRNGQKDKKVFAFSQVFLSIFETYNLMSLVA